MKYVYIKGFTSDGSLGYIKQVEVIVQKKDFISVDYFFGGGKLRFNKKTGECVSKEDGYYDVYHSLATFDEYRDFVNSIIDEKIAIMVATISLNEKKLTELKNSKINLNETEKEYENRSNNR